MRFWYIQLIMRKLGSFLFWLCLVFLFSSCYSRSATIRTRSISVDGIQAAEEEDSAALTRGLVLYPEDAELPVSSFGEIWAYLVAGREHTLKAEYPLTDIGYFSADVDSYGSLSDIPDRKNISFFKGRVHLVSTCNGRALTHFVLAEGSRERKELIRDLLKASEAFDGLQIDYENVAPKDGEAFLSFLKELRLGLKDKIFTIALPARTRSLSEDVYDYRNILPFVDRILVMAYDEHWSTSAPGPIASMGWCRRVALYSMETIGAEKLIMGLPFYGRSWGDINPNRAYYHSGIERMREEQGFPEIQREDGIPNFNYTIPLSVTVYYEDEYSLAVRLGMYKRLGVSSVGFWCLGQETPAFWPLLSVSR